jgi:RHS repeat-associated protein
VIVTNTSKGRATAKANSRYLGATEENEVNQAQGHKANDVFAPKGAWQSDVSAPKNALGYEPFGSLLPGRNYSSGSYRFGLNGQEKDDEVYGATGTSYTAEFWQYDPRTGRRWNMDPVDKPWMSPYHAFSNKPILNVDPNGANDSPIYDKAGEFLGTDDQGLTGDAIVMEKSEFTQGMSHADAMAKGTTAANACGQSCISNEAKQKIDTHYTGLSSRPDYDGVVTPSEGIDWAKQRPGVLQNGATPNDYLYLDAAKMNFGDLTADYFCLHDGVGQSTWVNLLNHVDYLSTSSRSTTYALGQTRMTLLNEYDVRVIVENGYFNAYDWNLDRDAEGDVMFTKRNNMLRAERALYGLDDTHGVPLSVYGVGRLKQ